jgi:hypothetical protein
MATKTKHTPTPWEASGTMPATDRKRASITIGRFVGTDYRAVLAVYGDTEEQADAEADFVLRACNSHHNLLAACKKAQRPRELLTAEELGERLRVRPDTVRAWSRRGLIPRLELSYKVIRYDPVAVIAALTDRKKGGDRG